MNARLSDKIRVVSLLTMVLLTFVHAFTFPSNVFQGDPWSLDGINFTIQYFISNGLARFRVPMFFIISGYFFVRAIHRPHDGFANQFTKRLRTIAVPYLAWSILGLLLYAIMQWPQATRGLFPNNPVWGLRAVDVLRKILLDPIPYQLWFLRDLMVLFALSPLFLILIRWFGAWVLLPAAVCWWWDIDPVIVRTGSITFYLAGIWLFLRGPDSPPVITNPGRRAIVATWLVVLVAKTAVVVTNTGDADAIRILHKGSTFLGLAAVWVWYDLIVGDRDIRKSWLYPLTAHSFFLYVAHEPLLSVVKRSLFLLLGHHPAMAFVVYVIAPCLVMVICFGTARVLARHVPGLYGFFTGGRGVPKVDPQAKEVALASS